MLRPRSLILLPLCLALALWFGVPMRAAEVTPPCFSVEAKEELRRGEKLELVIRPAREDVASFLWTVRYDPETVGRADADLSGMQDAYVQKTLREGEVSGVCTAEKGGTFSRNDTILVTLETERGTEAESVSATLEITDAANGNAEPLLSAPEVHEVRAAFSEEPSGESKLRSLTPPEGKLVPDFSPDVFAYTLDVPFSTVTLQFAMEPPEGGTVQVNRKNLGAGGSTVDFVITVTAANGTDRSVYTVAVTRGPRPTAVPATPKPTPTPKPTATPKPAGTAKPASTPKRTAGGGGKGSSGGETSAGGGTGDTPTGNGTGDGNAESGAPVQENVAYLTRDEQRGQSETMLLTAAIVLFSVAFGAAGTLVFLRLLRPSDKDSKK